jgi:ATP-dependent helicase/DNAse subunit B
MLLDGYFEQQPLALAEARVQVAAALVGKLDQQMPGLPTELAAQLRLAHTMAEARFACREFTAYDGYLAEPAALHTVAQRYSATRVFSPTALEGYVACPFRFYLEHVLRLEELDEPGDAIEQTRRGSAYHRALSRLHNTLRHDQDVNQARIPEHVTSTLQSNLHTAIAEYIDRAPSQATKVLWELERTRLNRTVPHYRQHWDDYLAPWRELGVHLTPRWLEADFGLPSEPTNAGVMLPLQIDIQGIRVQIGGRIDRVDVGEIADGLGFWIIDYKTGRTSNYTANGVRSLEKMQLPLYALAVEKVLAQDRPARPLGLAYWLVTGSGPKPVLPGSGKKATAWLSDARAWANFRAQLEAWVVLLVARIRDCLFPLAPRSDDCTAYCPYSRVCRITQSRHVGKDWDLNLPTAEAVSE